MTSCGDTLQPTYPCVTAVMKSTICCEISIALVISKPFLQSSHSISQINYYAHNGLIHIQFFLPLFNAYYVLCEIWRIDAAFHVISIIIHYPK